MDITTIRTALLYLIQPADTSAGGRSQRESVEDLPEKILRRFGILKACLWICLAVIVSLCLSNLR